jgi:hypothetical protein
MGGLSFKVLVGALVRVGISIFAVTPRFQRQQPGNSCTNSDDDENCPCKMAYWSTYMAHTRTYC